MAKRDIEKKIKAHVHKSYQHKIFDSHYPFFFYLYQDLD